MEVLVEWTFNGGINISGFIKNLFICILKRRKSLFGWNIPLNLGFLREVFPMVFRKP